MKKYPTENIRNVVLVGHQGCGKTSLVEALAYNTGATTRLGSISERNTLSDWEDEEKSRGISLSTSLVTLEFESHKINILDTPGFADFQGEIRNAMRVADAVVVVVDAVAGVEVGTELVWEYARRFQQPVIVVINKMDRENANYEQTLQQLRSAFSKYKFVPVIIPIGKEDEFQGIANIVTEKAYMGIGKDRSELPADMIPVVEEARFELVEAAAEADDALLQKYFDEETLSADEIREGMRKASRSHLLHTVPVFVTSGLKNIGTIPLLEAMIAYVSPPSMRRVRIFRGEEVDYLTPPQSDEGKLSAYVFKTSTDRYVGTLNYIRVFSGRIQSDSRYYNASTDTEERFASLFTMRGKEQLPVDELVCGDIGVVAKLNNTTTGNTFRPKDDHYRIAQPTLPNPLYAVSITPKSQADSAKMGPVLSSLAAADPTLRWRFDPDTHDTVLEGMGEIHVNVAIKRAETLGVELDTNMPKVPYRETVTRKAESTYRHRKQSGGAGQFGEVSLSVEPCDEEFIFESKIFGGAISTQFQASAEKGVRAVLPEGVIAGYPITQVKVIVFDGKEHPVDSKDIAFQIAGREAFKAAFKEAGPILQEPILSVRIIVPESMMGDIMSDLNTRRGRVQGMDSENDRSVIRAQVPQSEMLRYGDTLRSITGGRGIYEAEFFAYESMPRHILDEVLANIKTDA